MTIDCDMMAINCDKMAIDCDMMATDCDMMAFDCDMMVIDCDMMAIDCDMMAIDCDMMAIDCDMMAIKCDMTAIDCALKFERNISFNILIIRLLMVTLHFQKTLLILLVSTTCMVTFINGELPTTRQYQPQKKIKTAQKVTSYVPQQPADSPTNFGFVPTKTADNYAQKEPLGRYVYPDLLGQTQTYTRQFPKYQPQTQVIYNPQTTYLSQPQVSASYNQQGAQQVTQQYVHPQQYVQQYVPASQSYDQNYIYQTPQTQQPQYYYQPATKHINYISDNNVPQYVYLQQIPEPSNTVENVVDPKSQGIGYIMLIPTYVNQQPETQNYYVTKQSAGHDLGYAAVPEQPDQQIQYVYNTESEEYGKGSTYKKEPTSLLDSYVPSVLQIQYYKRLASQAQANQIVDNAKTLANNLKRKNAKHER
ncbi:hypothetical protein HHI36_009898 [Cryptolaemus montrouzieri]|uniref:Uncharacterized protein n=1 Tax=Cryptolaemus montrouzieri TaxID=559131 RepID=A0ABD2MH87_9CUCU